MPTRRRLSAPLSLLLVLLVALASCLAAAPSADAAEIVPVEAFGDNPGELKMYVYRPDGVAAGAAAVVLLHGCQQNADAYFTNTGWRELADKHGFVLITPDQQPLNNPAGCFDWFDAGDIDRGKGEGASIVTMVDYATANFGIDRTKVYLAGLSGGAAMTAALLTAYPDRFAGGSITAGVPVGCATGPAEALTCMDPGEDKTPAEWGALARDRYPGYTGPRPKVAIWHGQSDTITNPQNAEELRDQFTDLAGVAATPTGTGLLAPGATVDDHAGKVRLYRLAEVDHGAPVHPGDGPTDCGRMGVSYFVSSVCGAYYDAQYFGLLTGPGPELTPAPNPPGVPEPPPADCITTNNINHIFARRAYFAWFYAYAYGSHVNLGLATVFTRSSIHETRPGYFEPC